MENPDITIREVHVRSRNLSNFSNDKKPFAFKISTFCQKIRESSIFSDKTSLIALLEPMSIVKKISEDVFVVYEF